ncbi:MAG: Ig-like domain-containing protein, partial [Pseudolysinimonas sp.]
VGTDTFVYNFTDPDTGLTSNNATVTITIATDPVANDDTYDVDAGSVLNVPAPAEFGNDTGNFGPLVEDTPHPTGYVQSGVGPTTAFTYTPPPGFAGVASFTYHYTDTVTHTDSNIATVTFRVHPVAVDDEFDVPCDFNGLPFYFVTDNDPNAGFFTDADQQSDVSNGTLFEIFFGVFVYIPDNNFAGDDSFTYTYDVDGVTSNVATVTFHVEGDCDDHDGHHGHHHDGDDPGDSDGVLPNTGSGISPWTLSFAGMSLLAGFVIVRRSTKRA